MPVEYTMDDLVIARQAYDDASERVARAKLAGDSVLDVLDVLEAQDHLRHVMERTTL